MHLQLAKPGEAVGGSRYKILGRIGAGGMAEVDLALQTGVAGSSRLCALKRVRKDLAQYEEFVAMFYEEARISASLSHPNVVQVYEVGGDEHECFLAMELLRGRSYAHLQRNAAADTLDYRVALEVMLATLSGLEHAHERRDLKGQPMHLVHRDISPPNVFVTYEGEIKVLDFGVAKSKDSLIRTEAGILKGKIAYMAPEVVAGTAVDARADLYAVGVMLWEATARRDRWPGMNEMAILAQLSRAQAPQAPGATENGLPQLADEICLRALEHAPEDRYESAAQLRADVQQLCELMGGRLGQSQIKDYMTRRFASERRREEREIDEALDLDARPTRESEPPAFGGTKRLSYKRRESEAVEGALAPTQKSRGRWWVALAVVALAAVVVVKLVQTSEETRSAGSAKVDAVALSAPSTSVTGRALLPPQAAPERASAPVAAEAPAAAVSSKAATTTKKPVRAPRPAAVGKPPAAGSEAQRKLQLDRQDPWQE